MNLEMVKVVLAEVYRGKPAKRRDLELFWKAENVAREADRGMLLLGIGM